LSHSHNGPLSRFVYCSAFFFLSSTMSTFSFGTPLNTPSPFSIISATSPATSPCTTISSCPCTFLETDAPVAKRVASCFAAFFKSMSNASSPCIAVTCFRLVRSIRLMVTYNKIRETLNAEEGSVESNALLVKPTFSSMQPQLLLLPSPPFLLSLSRAWIVPRESRYPSLLEEPLHGER